MVLSIDEGGLFTAAGAQKLILERPGTLGIQAALSGDKSTEPNQPGEWGWLRRSLALDDRHHRAGWLEKGPSTCCYAIHKETAAALGLTHSAVSRKRTRCYAASSLARMRPHTTQLQGWREAIAPGANAAGTRSTFSRGLVIR